MGASHNTSVINVLIHFNSISVSDNILISKIKMAMWADNVKFVKDIIDSKYQKIDAAVAEVNYKFIESNMK